MNNPKALYTILIIGAIFMCPSLTKAEELKTVGSVDLNRYCGLWYEIANLPNSFQKNCVATTAEYSLRPDGIVKVVNSCRVKTLDGKAKSITGKAWVSDKKTNSKLNVQFFWPFYGKYWIIDLAPDYSYAVVGHPNRKFLWILSRTPAMDETLYNEILVKLKALGFDVSKIVKTLQPN
jgi:apolipoprotein D and lipocalin family protein